MKSSIVQKLEKYFVNPSANHFKTISIINITQNPKFVQYNIRFNGILLSKCISSKHSVILEANINTRTNHSNAGVSTTDNTARRTPIQRTPNFVSIHLFQHGHLIKTIIILNYSIYAIN